MAVDTTGDGSGNNSPDGLSYDVKSAKPAPPAPPPKAKNPPEKPRQSEERK